MKGTHQKVISRVQCTDTREIFKYEMTVSMEGVGRVDNRWTTMTRLTPPVTVVSLGSLCPRHHDQHF